MVFWWYRLQIISQMKDRKTIPYPIPKTTKAPLKWFKAKVGTVTCQHNGNNIQSIACNRVSKESGPTFGDSSKMNAAIFNILRAIITVIYNNLKNIWTNLNYRS